MKKKKRKMRRPFSLRRELRRFVGIRPKRRRKTGKRISGKIWPLVFAVMSFVGLIFILQHMLLEPVKNDNPTNYFETMAPYAIHYGERNHIFPSLILAQSALESDFGRSQLATEYHNYFGIKQTGNEPGVVLSTTEHLKGNDVIIKDGFRSYKDVRASIVDYVNLLSHYERYSSVVAAKTVEEAAYGLVAGGYATDPIYAEKIINLINTYNLKKYDSNYDEID